MHTELIYSNICVCVFMILIIVGQICSNDLNMILLDAVLNL